MEVTRTCPKCAEEIKLDAVVCKHCKSDVPALTNSQKRKLVKEAKEQDNLPGSFVILTFVVLGAFLYWKFASVTSTAESTDPKSQEVAKKVQSSTDSDIPSEPYLKRGWIGCSTEKGYERGLDMMINKEWEALAVLVSSGACARLEAGPVSIEESNWTMVRVRPRGSLTAYWTGIEMVEKR